MGTLQALNGHPTQALDRTLWKGMKEEEQNSAMIPDVNLITHYLVYCV